MQEAVRLARESVSAGGGPFGAVVVKDGRIIGRGSNRVTETLDPTAHAEIVAIREACRQLHDYNLAGCSLYASCRPCPMCLSTCHWARLDAVFYATPTEQATAAGFDDQAIEDAICHGENGMLILQQLRIEGDEQPFRDWLAFPGRQPY